MISQLLTHRGQQLLVLVKAAAAQRHQFLNSQFYGYYLLLIRNGYHCLLCIHIIHLGILWMGLLPV